MKTKYNTISEFLDDVLNIINTEENDTKVCENKCDVVREEQKDNKENKTVDTRPPKENKPLKPIINTVTFEDPNFYILNEMVNNCAIASEQHLIFEHTSEDGYRVPGITEYQLLSVLYNRYKNNPKKLDLVRQLMI